MITRNIVLSLVCLAFMPACAGMLHAQTIPALDAATSGTHYYIAFPDTVRNSLATYYPNTRVRSEASVWIYSAVDTKVTITASSGSPMQLNVSAGKFRVYSLPTGAVVDAVNTVSPRTFEVTSAEPIILYCYFASIQGLEAWAPIPVDRWGTDYVAAAVAGVTVGDVQDPISNDIVAPPKPAPAEILLLAAYDNTQVTLTAPPAASFSGSVPTVIYLNAGQAYLVQGIVDTASQAASNLAATKIHANKPIGVISGTTRAKEDAGIGLVDNAAKNMVIEWLPPIDELGRQFVQLPSWDTHRPGIGASAERKQEYVQVYSTRSTAVNGMALIPGVGPTPFVAARDSFARFSNTTATAIAFTTDAPAMAMMHSSAITKFNGSTLCAQGDCLSYSTWAPYMVEMVPREQWTSFAPYYAPLNPGTMLHYVSVVTDTVSARSIYLQDGSRFTFTRLIPGTDLIWGTRSVNPGADCWLEGRNGARFYAVAFGMMEGGEEYRPNDGLTQFEEYNAVAYGYPLAPGRRVLKHADTLRIDTLMDCTVLTVKVNAINANPVGLFSVQLDPATNVNAKLNAVTPVKLSDIVGSTKATVKVEPVDVLKNADAVVIITDRTGATWRIIYHYEAGNPTTVPDKELNFGIVEPGTPIRRDLTLSNPLSMPITLKEIQLAVGRYYTIADIQPRHPSTTIAPGEPFTVTIESAPDSTSQSSVVDTLLIITQCTRSSVVLKTTKAAACIDVGDLPFGQFIISVDGRKSLSLRITNTGTAALRFVAPYVTWPSPDYSMDPADMAALQTLLLQPDSSYVIHVTFTPPPTLGHYSVIARFFTNSECDDNTSNWTADVTGPSAVAGSLGAGYELHAFVGDNGIAVRFGTARAARIRIELFDDIGRSVAVVRDEHVAAGEHDLRIPTAGLAGGTYYLRMTSGTWTRTAPVVITR